MKPIEYHRNRPFVSVVGLFPDQLFAMSRCVNFILGEKSPRVMRFKAKGGVGKTHTIREMIKILETKVKGKSYKGVMIAFTGRAASQLAKGGLCSQTSHSLLYRPVMDEDGDLISWEKNNQDEIREAYDFLILDEGSMMPSGILGDIFELGLPIIIMGDDCQLDAVDEEWENFNVMSGDHTEWDFLDLPDVELTVNRRIAPDMQGITDLTEHLRRINTIPKFDGPGLSYETKKKVQTVKFHRENKFDAIICGTHKIRKKMNNLVRRSMGYDEIRPEIGERLMNKVNTTIKGETIYNGELFVVTGRIDDVDKATYFLTRDDGNVKVVVDILDETLTSEKKPRRKKKGRGDDEAEKAPNGFFVYGYAMTCHSAQGSTFDRVLFFDEDVGFFLERKKFRYTAVSRAAKSLVVAV